MGKIEFVTEEHHRRPKSLGGTDNLFNISYVPPRLHKNWHTMMGNMNAYQIANWINKSPFKPAHVFIECRFINGEMVTKEGENYSKNKSKISHAWLELFGDFEYFSDIISYINNVWLDPSYHFYVHNI